MLPFKDFMKFKMRTQRAGPWNYLINSLVLLALVAFVFADDTSSSTPARLLAKQTGASQFEEERLEPHSDCNDRKRHQKRSSDEDIDYEVYQGVVGRPGIDFPIYPRIPKTSFSCRSFGNGYFADMETDCQVFHICEEGRKISFLCPNGTIFQQSELTCDWWFKVNCLGSPGYYAESAEILNKQRVQRIRPSVPVSVGFNIVGGGSVRSNSNNNKHRVDSAAHNKQAPSGHRNKPERRIDSNEEPALESVDFDDVSGEKQLKHSGKSKVNANIDSNNNNDESQITAESASILGTNWRNSQHAVAEQPRTEPPRKTSESRIGTVPARLSGGSNRRGYTGQTNDRPAGSYESRERSRNSDRGRQRYTDEKKPLVESFEINSSGERQEPKKPFVLPEKIIKASAPTEARSKSSSSSNILAESPSGKSDPDTYTHRSVDKAVPSTTAFYPSGTYSTARRFESTKSTPFYTPTVPTISKSKTTEGKTHYVKGSAVTTPNPNRFNGGGGSGSGLFFESSAAPKISTTTTATPKSSDASHAATTLRSFVIGMRHEVATPDYRIPLTAQNLFNGEKKDSQITTTTPASTRPTYLPKSGFDTVPTIEAGGDSLLFAPVPSSKNDHLSLNVKGMLKAMDYIKDELKDVESVGPRVGLEIPPSSGPNAVHSLAVYYGLSEAEDKSVKAPASVASSTTTTTKKPTSSSASSSSSSYTSTSPSSNDKSSLPSKSSSPSGSLTAKVLPSGDIKASLLSEKTQSKYTNLFGLTDPKGKNLDDISRGLAGSSAESDSATDKYSKQQPFPQIGSTDATISKLASTEGYRTIAKEFSNALTTYLETPDKLRQQLQAVRPTPPSSRGKGESSATDATLFQRGTAASYLPTQATQTETSRFTTTTTQDSIAAEINSKFDYSTVTPDFASTTDVFDTTTYRPSRKPVTEFSGEVLPRGNESGESEGEILQRENTQSFVNARNQLGYDKPLKSKGSGEKSGVTTKPKTTENPWNHASQTDFLDPLTINDGLMKETKTTEATPFVKERFDKTTTASSVGGRGQINVLSSDTGRKFVGSAEVTTTTTRLPYYYERSQGGTDSWGDILSSYDLPRETLPSSSGLQRIANKIFGGLNESEALHLKNVMAEAEHNRQVLSLLLLLIQTCDDLNGKALERSRKHLLNALIDMDSKLKPGKQKAAPLLTTTARTINSSPTAAYYTATTDQLPLSTTTTATINTSTVGSAVEETTKFEIRVEDPEEEMASSTVAAAVTTAPGGSAARGDTSDKRALELLKSLYSLASKFTSRR